MMKLRKFTGFSLKTALVLAPLIALPAHAGLVVAYKNSGSVETAHSAASNSSAPVFQEQPAASLGMWLSVIDAPDLSAFYRTQAFPSGFKTLKANLESASSGEKSQENVPENENGYINSVVNNNTNSWSKLDLSAPVYDAESGNALDGLPKLTTLLAMGCLIGSGALFRTFRRFGRS